MDEKQLRVIGLTQPRGAVQEAALGWPEHEEAPNYGASSLSECSALRRDTAWAMSEENVENLRTVYAEWSEGNFRPVTDVYGPDMDWGWSEEFPDLGRVVRETAAKSERLVRWLSSWEKWRVEPEDFIASGDHVVVLCRYTGRGKGSGVEVDTHGAHLWTFREGKAIRLEVFSNRERALEAAGLRE